MKIAALHGFLGKPSDWTDLFQGHPLQEKISSENLFSQNIQKMSDWAEAFNAAQKKDEQNVLIGYSLGGRLAIHALLQNPNIWSAAIIISAHAGIANDQEKLCRYDSDEQWAQRFEKDPWEKLIHDWNERSVFQNDAFHFKRKESDYSRDILASALRKWSLSQQQNLHEKISQLNIPIFWIAGEKDSTYAEQAQRVSLSHPLSKIWVVPESGHRVPWEHPQQFLSNITCFLNQTAESNIAKI